MTDTGLQPDPLADTLRAVFGFDAFRPGQGEIVAAVAAGRDVLAIMPTGGGKSLCYQLPALHLPGVTLVISPLIALIRDQVAAMRAAGVEAGALTSANTPEETEETLDAMRDGRLKLLYMAPERLASAERMLTQASISMIAVDEAHCVSQWGHDFRPDYLRIGALREALGHPPLAAFTATADEETQGEIVARLFDKPPEMFLRGFDRPNLFLAFSPKNRPQQQILDFATARRGRAGIVYASSRRKTEELAAALKREGLNASPYHAGLDAEIRRDTQERFQREDDMVIVATIAFGMGVDKPDIRYVAHADLPKSIESYWQEIGRAGRDGAPAETLTLYGLDDMRLRRTQIDEGHAPPERKRLDHERLDALLALAESATCRRQMLLGYFGETLDPPCNGCDVCRGGVRVWDATVAAQKALSAVLRTGERFGSEHLIAILRGEPTEKVRERGHDALPTFGVGRDVEPNAWRGLFRQLYARGVIWRDPDRHGAWRCGEAARGVLKGDGALELRVDETPARERRKRAPVAAVVPDDLDAELMAALRAARKALAEAQRVPAYVIFPDRTLIDMAERRPTTREELSACHGVGARKLEKYGDSFLAVLRGERAPG